MALSEKEAIIIKNALDTANNNARESVAVVHGLENRIRLLESKLIELENILNGSGSDSNHKRE